jgi:hypothetical protein
MPPITSLAAPQGLPLHSTACDVLKCRCAEGQAAAAPACRRQIAELTRKLELAAQESLDTCSLSAVPAFATGRCTSA